MLDGKVARALGAGARALSAVTGEVTAALPAPQRFVEAGRVAQTVARLAHASSAIDRPWVPVGGDLLIEDWAIRAARAEAPGTPGASTAGPSGGPPSTGSNAGSSTGPSAGSSIGSSAGPSTGSSAGPSARPSTGSIAADADGSRDSGGPEAASASRGGSP